MKQGSVLDAWITWSWNGSPWFNGLVGHAKISAVDVYYEKWSLLRLINLKNARWQTIERIDRRGKYLLFRFNDDLTMVSHLRMEGKYDVRLSWSSNY